MIPGPMSQMGIVFSRFVPGRLVPLMPRYLLAFFAALLLYSTLTSQIWTSSPRHLRVSNSNNNNNGANHGQSGVLGDLPARLDRLVSGHAAPESAPEPVQIPIEDPLPQGKVYKPDTEPFSPVSDPFPWLTANGRKPPLLLNNLPPDPHVPEQTPLFIGFTHNWPTLIQCVASYIAAGWPAGDIYVVENTGAFRANVDRKLGLQNPLFLNHTQLWMLGVNVLQTPALLSFSQLQNYYLSMALQRNWPRFFWTREDIVVFSDEEVRKKDRDHNYPEDPYATIYERAVGLMRYLDLPDMPLWATHFFAYDGLTLVNRDAYLDVGGWDPLIPFFASDCDMHLRLHWAGYWQPQSEAGLVYDVGGAGAHLLDAGALFRLPGAHAAFVGDPLFEDPLRPMREADAERERGMRAWVAKEGESHQHLVAVVQRMVEVRARNGRGAGGGPAGGQDEPFYRDPAGYAAGLGALADAGRRVFAEKWGHRGCDLAGLGIEAEDAWRLERDWDPLTEGPGSENGDWSKEWNVM